VKRLWQYVLRYRLRYLVGTACLFTTASMVMAIPYFTRLAIDAIRGGAPDATSVVARCAGAIVALALFQALVRTLSRTLIFNTGRDIEYELRNDLFRHLETLPQAYYQRQRTGDLMSRLVNDIGAVRLMLGPGILTFINTPVYCTYAFTLMLFMDVRLTLAAMVPFPILLWVVKHYSRAMMEATMRTQEKLADMSSFVQEHLSGIHVVKAYVREEARAETFRELNDEFKYESMEVAKLRGRVFPFIRIVSSLGVLVVLYYGGILVVGGSLTLGELVAFIAYLHILAWPIMALGWMITIYQRGRAALVRLGEILDTVPTIRNRPDPVIASGLRGEITFEGVEFGYASPGNGHPILREIDLRVPAGSSLGVIGRTGSGKSTLAMLVPRLFDVTAGRVTVDGIDVRDWELQRLRSGIGFVPQDPFLFSQSIGQNIEFARPDVTQEEVMRMIEMAGLDADLAEFPHGVETQVGERGVTLSGGQKQRLTLARAVARDPRILVLDDALSSVDAATEKRILDELEDVMRDRTTIIISHRVSSVRLTDQIAVVENGRIVERGTHPELVELDGVYADLYRRQRLTDELEAM
jgi:ATP-binding cassette subfamily B multidrug efflux pump